MSKSSSSTKVAVKNSVDMSRNTALAGQRVKQGQNTVEYDADGYAVSAIRDGGTSATSYKKASNTDSTPTHSQMYQAAQNGNWDEVGRLSHALIDSNGDFSEGQAYIRELADEFGYNAADYYNRLYNQAYKNIDAAAVSASNGSGNPAASTTGRGGISGGGLYATALKNSGGNAAGGDMISQLLGLYGEEGSYAAALKQQQAANQAGVDKAVNELEDRKTDTNQEYSNLFRQLYLNKMAAKKNLGQQMAAQGVTGGAAESTMLGIDTHYDEALRQGEEGRIAAMSELDRAINDAQLTGDITSAQLAADNARERTSSYAAVLQNLINRYDTLAANELGRQNTLDAIQREEAESAKAYAYQTAMQILQGGNMASDELLESAGISRDDAASIVSAAVAARKTAASTQTKAPSYTEGQAMIAVQAALSGDASDSTRTIIEKYYGLPMETVIKAYGGTVNDAETVEADIKAMIQEGTTRSEVSALINSAIGKGWIDSSTAAALRTKYLH